MTNFMETTLTPNSSDSSTPTTSTTVGSLSRSTQNLLDLYIDRKRELKKLATFVDDLHQQIQHAISLGELDSCIIDKNRFQHGPLTITGVQRKTWKYSAAVKTLQEQEQFEGVATQTISESYRFNISDE